MRNGSRWGRRLPGAPRADPSAQHYCTGLLPWVRRRCLMRARALCTLARLCVRCVFCWFAFPLARSIPSASSFPPSFVALGAPWRLQRFRLRARLGLPWLRSPASPAVVRELRRYYEAVRLPAPFIDGLSPRTSHRGPRLYLSMDGRRVSRFSHKVLPRMLSGSSTTPGPSTPRLGGVSDVAFGIRNHLGTWN